VVNRSIDFFETQFQRQVSAHDFTLNPFEEAALPYLTGRVLDLGCGLGNLSIAAARRGCEVIAVDASPTAIKHLAEVARNEQLPVTAVESDIDQFNVHDGFDVVVAIGLLMFFRREVALKLMQMVKDAVKPGGCAIVNVLIQGTTFMDMFDGERYCLFTSAELEAAFAGWTLHLSREDEFPAPKGTVKRFMTVVARRQRPQSA
jgi:tellurite methyltransferase